MAGRQGSRLTGPGTLRVHTEMYHADGSGNVGKGEVVRKFPEQPSLIDSMALETYELRRTENYVALFAGLKIPYQAEVTWGTEHSSHYDFSEVFLTSSQRWELPLDLPGIYRSAGVLLEALLEDSYEGKAAENVGAAALETDPDRRYVCAWNAVELLAKSHYIRSNGLDLKKRNGGLERLPKVSDFVRPFLKEFHDGPGHRDVEWLAALRNGAAHGGLSDPPGSSYAEHTERWDKVEPMRDLAFEVLINFLGQLQLIPKWPRPVHARVMVPSFRPDWKLQSNDDSSVLTSRGPRWKNRARTS